jgi:UBX domain-containing protein 1
MVLSYVMSEPKKDDKDKKNTDSYTGGHSSGLAVENPDEDWMENMKKQPDQKEDYDKSENKLTLTVYKNGFVVDEGGFRDVLEPANKKFMDEIEKGFIPQELVDQGKTQLAIALIDKK